MSPIVRIAACAAALLLSASSLQAAPIVSITEVAGATPAARLAQKAALLSSLGGYTILEDFEGFTASASPSAGFTSLVTGAGTFSRAAGASHGAASGACIKDGGACKEMHVLDAATSPFSGRYNTTPGLAARQGNWLDSNDIDGIRLELTPARTNLFFFLTDVSDQGGTLTVKGFDGTWSQQAILPTKGNGALFLVQLSQFSGLSSIEFRNSRTGDGWGIDDIGTQSVPVPEPTELMLLGAVLLGAATRLRRRVA